MTALLRTKLVVQGVLLVVVTACCMQVYGSFSVINPGAVDDKKLPSTFSMIVEEMRLAAISSVSARRRDVVSAFAAVNYDSTTTDTTTPQTRKTTDERKLPVPREQPQTLIMEAFSAHTSTRQSTDNLPPLLPSDVVPKKNATKKVYAKYNWTDLPDCLRPNTSHTLRLVEQYRNHPIARPVLNMGMPKMGSTTLQFFFGCAGFRAQKLQEGVCFRKAHAENKPVLATCAYQKFWKGKSVEAWTQMDTNFPPKNCHYPQMSELEQIHEEAPNATFILMIRPFADWYRSLNHFHNMRQRIAGCDLPGLPKGKGRWTDMKTWLCGHITNLRAFCQKYPTHELVEMDLYSDDTPHLMAQLFHTNASCWRHANKNKKLKSKTEQAKSAPNQTVVVPKF